MTLGEFLLKAALEPKWHCSTMEADWCLENGKRDFAWAWRGDMSDDECQKASASGLVKLWDEGIGDGLRVTTAPQAGDIAVVLLLGHETGAICTGDKWAIRAERGIGFIANARVTVLKAWAL